MLIDGTGKKKDPLNPLLCKKKVFHFGFFKIDFDRIGSIKSTGRKFFFKRQKRNIFFRRTFLVFEVFGHVFIEKKVFHFGFLKIDFDDTGSFKSTGFRKRQLRFGQRVFLNEKKERSLFRRTFLVFEVFGHVFN